MADLDKIMTALRNAHSAGDTAAAQRLAEMARRARDGGPSYEVTGTDQNGGQFLRLPDGREAYRSEGFSTVDPARIAQLREGMTPANALQSDFDQERIAANPVAARAASMAQGMPFVGSYVDEIYSEGRGANIRALQSAMEREKPGQALGFNLAGGVAAAAPLAVAAGPTITAKALPTVGGRAIQAGVAGAAAGAVEGAVYGSGDQSGEGRAANAKTGAQLGAAVGLGLGVAAPYAAESVKMVMQTFRRSDLSTIARELNISQDAAREVRNAITSGDEAAAAAALQRAGANSMLADATQSAGQLLDASAQTGGPASRIAGDAVSERTQQATGRMEAALDRALGAPQGEREIIDGIRQQSATARSTAYDAAYASPIDYSKGTGRRLESLLARVPDEAIRRAQRLMDIREETSAQIMAQIGDNGRVTFEQMPDVRQVHYIMQALDDMASSTDGKGVFGRQNAMGASIESLRSDIGNTLKRAVPEFGNAQNIAADTARQVNMTESGYTMLRPSTRREDVVRTLSGASDAEKQAMRQGVRSYLDDVTANVARTITDPDNTTREGIKVLRDLSTRSNQTKLRALLGEDEAQALLSEIDEAATAFELRAAIAQNSKTAVRQSITDAAATASRGNVLQELGQGEPINATKRIVQAFTGQGPEAQQLRQMGLYEDVARALTEARGSRAQRALRIIQAANREQAISDNQARFVAQTLTTTGVLAGGRATSSSLTR